MYTATGGLCLILLFSVVHMANLLQKDGSNFGTYSLTWTKYEQCKGPKSKNATLLSTNFTQEGNYTIGHFNFTFLGETKIDEVKIVGFSLKSNTKNLLWTYKITEPCTHFLFGGVIETLFKAHNCVVNMGPYHISLNLNDIITSFFGSGFFYGEYMFKATVTSKQRNIICLIVVIKFTKTAEVKIL